MPSVSPAPADDLLFEGVRLFDGERFLEGPRTVLVRDGSIAEISTSPIPPGGSPKRRGGVLFPGFVDAHVHLSLSDAGAVIGGGVTAVLDLGEPLAYAFSDH